MGRKRWTKEEVFIEVASWGIVILFVAIAIKIFNS